MLCDSKSLVETIANSNQPDADVHRMQSDIAELQEERCSNPVGAGHCNLRGNELADLEAKLGSEVAQPSVPLDSPQSNRAALIR